MTTDERGGPYTRHGHPIEGITVVGINRPPVARCGGPGMCQPCAQDAERIRREHAAAQPAVDPLDGWFEPTACDNEHETEQPAVAIIHIIGSNSAANATALCAGCLVCFTEEWADEVSVSDPEAYSWEIRPVLPPPTNIEDEDDPAPALSAP